MAKHTAVADTPEARRLAENTKIQSQVKYHEEFERNMKGKATQVRIDVFDDIVVLREVLRIYLSISRLLNVAVANLLRK